jgi:hypothetical protein
MKISLLTKIIIIGIIVILLGIGMFCFGIYMFTYQGKSPGSIAYNLGLDSFNYWWATILIGFCIIALGYGFKKN